MGITTGLSWFSIWISTWSTRVSDKSLRLLNLEVMLLQAVLISLTLGWTNQGSFHMKNLPMQQIISIIGQGEVYYAELNCEVCHLCMVESRSKGSFFELLKWSFS